MILFAYNKYSWAFVDVGKADFAPFADSGGAYILIFRGYIASDAEFCLRSARGDNLLCHFDIAIWRFDEELRLMFASSTTLQAFDCSCALRLLYGEITIEGEGLTTQPRSHNCHNN